MAVRSLDDFLNGVARLIDEVVNHELILRDLTPQGGPVHNKRRQLARILHDEYMRNAAPAISPQNLTNDLRLSAHYITMCQVDLISTDPAIRERATQTLKHFQYKISRNNCNTQDEVDDCQRLLTVIRMILNSQNQPGTSPATPNTNTNVNTTSGIPNNPQSQPTHAQNTNPNTSTPSRANHNAQRQNLSAQFSSLGIGSASVDNNTQTEHTSRINAPKLYKWGIKFTNESKSLGVFEFIQKVEAEVKAYEIPHEKLYQSACELFDGFAAKWFLSQKFANWNDVKEKLISDFVQVDYLENLLDTIRQRKQNHNEPIVNFFTVFEDDCSRLPT